MNLALITITDEGVGVAERIKEIFWSGPYFFSFWGEAENV